MRRTLTLSIIDGVFFSVMVGAAETYFSPYAIALGASNLTLGLLLALPVLVGSLAQLFSVRLLSWVGNRRRLMALLAGLQAFAFLPMIAVGLSKAPARGAVFLGIVCVYFAFQLVAAPAWISLMGDLVPERERGAYFARHLSRDAGGGAGAHLVSRSRRDDARLRAGLRRCDGEQAGVDGFSTGAP